MPVHACLCRSLNEVQCEQGLSHQVTPSCSPAAAATIASMQLDSGPSVPYCLLLLNTSLQVTAAATLSARVVQQPPWLTGSPPLLQSSQLHSDPADAVCETLQKHRLMRCGRPSARHVHERMVQTCRECKIRSTHKTVIVLCNKQMTPYNR